MAPVAGIGAAGVGRTGRLDITTGAGRQRFQIRGQAGCRLGGRHSLGRRPQRGNRSAVRRHSVPRRVVSGFCSAIWVILTFLGITTDKPTLSVIIWWLRAVRFVAFTADKALTTVLFLRPSWQPVATVKSMCAWFSG